jgi:hypothetical protein
MLRHCRTMRGRSRSSAVSARVPQHGTVFNNNDDRVDMDHACGPFLNESEQFEQPALVIKPISMQRARYSSSRKQS